MTAPSQADFKRHYETHLKHLRLKGLQPKTIEVYARAIRRIGAYFDHQINDLFESQLTDYFTDLLQSHSWSAVKLDLCAAQALGGPWIVLAGPRQAPAHVGCVASYRARAASGASRGDSFPVHRCPETRQGLLAGVGAASGGRFRSNRRPDSWSVSGTLSAFP